MGKIEVKGCASKTVEYDLMKIEINFYAQESTSSEASEKVMHECEEFLGILKKGGFDISSISLMRDSVDRTRAYHNDEQVEVYQANRVLELNSKFDMKMINDIRSIANNIKSQGGIDVRYELSNEDDIRQALLTEALKDAKRQAEIMAQAIDQKVVGLISADKKKPEQEYSFWGEVLCQSLSCGPDIETYENSDELAPSSKTYTETINTTWEIA